MNFLDDLDSHINQIDQTMLLWISRFDLTYNQFAVLYSLIDAEMSGGICTQKQIGDDWYLPKQTVFNLCKSYREQGWLEFVDSDHDKREKILRLTESGRQHTLPIFNKNQIFSEKIANQFGKRKTAQLFTLLSELNQIIQTELDKNRLPNNAT